MIAKRLCSLDEYERMIEGGLLTEERVELIRGEMIEMNPHGDPHIFVIRGLTHRLVEAFGRNYWVHCQLSMRLPPDSMPEPDFAIFPRNKSELTGNARRTPSDPLVVIEVSDSSIGYNRRRKLPLYAGAGIPEYWIIHVAAAQIEIHRQPTSGPDGAMYAEHHIARGDDPVSFTFDPSIVFRASDILRGE